MKEIIGKRISFDMGKTWHNAMEIFQEYEVAATVKHYYDKFANLFEPDAWNRVISSVVDKEDPQLVTFLYLIYCNNDFVCNINLYEEEIENMPKSVSFDNGTTWYDADEVLTNEMCKWRVYRYFDELTAAMEDEARESAHLLLFDDYDTEESKLWFVYLYLKHCKNDLVIG